jgi:hypothetical protein
MIMRSCSDRCGPGGGRGAAVGRSGEIGGDSVGRGAVQTVAGMVVASRCAGVAMAGVVLHITQRHPASNANVMPVWRSECGDSRSHSAIPASAARRRTSSHS